MEGQVRNPSEPKVGKKRGTGLRKRAGGFGLQERSTNKKRGVWRGNCNAANTAAVCNRARGKRALLQQRPEEGKNHKTKTALLPPTAAARVAAAAEQRAGWFKNRNPDQAMRSARRRGQKKLYLGRAP